MDNPKTTPEADHNSTLFVLIEQYQPLDGKYGAILEIAKSSAKSIEGTPGLLLAQVLEPKSKSSAICNVTTWNSEAEFKTFMKSDAVKDLYSSETMSNVKAWTANIDTQMFTMVQGWHQ